MGWLYLGGRTVQEVGGEMMMGLSIYGVAVMDSMVLVYAEQYMQLQALIAGRSEALNPGSILMMCVRVYVRVRHA